MLVSFRAPGLVRRTRWTLNNGLDVREESQAVKHQTRTARTVACACLCKLIPDTRVWIAMVGHTKRKPTPYYRGRPDCSPSELRCGSPHHGRRSPLGLCPSEASERPLEGIDDLVADRADGYDSTFVTMR